MDTRSEEHGVTVEAGIGRARHAHDWRVVEVEFADGAALRVFECTCGASDVDVAA